jgi:hypothetical protein
MEHKNTKIILLQDKKTIPQRSFSRCPWLHADIFESGPAIRSRGPKGEWLLSRRDRPIVARHEVPGGDAERPSPGGTAEVIESLSFPNPGLKLSWRSGRRMAGAKHVLFRAFSDFENLWPGLFTDERPRNRRSPQ